MNVTVYLIHPLLFCMKLFVSTILFGFAVKWFVKLYKMNSYMRPASNKQNVHHDVICSVTLYTAIGWLHN